MSENRIFIYYDFLREKKKMNIRHKRYLSLHRFGGLD